MAELAIDIRALRFFYPGGEDAEDTPVFDDFNLSVESGSFTAILGHNGSGKSTLAKQMNAILLPCGGTVLAYGMDTKDETLLLQIRRSVGMVFQNPDNQIVSSLVEEDVAFGPENLGILPDEIRKRVVEALKTVGMLKYRNRAPHLLSGGQKQRVAIAGVIAMRPKCIVLDEPTAMLDPEGRQEVLDTIRRLNREWGITVILITHHMSEAAQADRVIALSGGKVLADGAPKEVFAQVELLRSARLSVPDTTQLIYELRAAGMEIPIDALSVDECAQALYNALKA